MSFDINYDIPTIITKRNVDSMENPIGVKLLEKKQVMDNHSCIVLSQIPDENYRITIEGFNEVFNSDELGNNNFYVSYSQGVVHFSPRYHGKTVVIEYYGIGYELISASRVFYKYDKRGNVIETLEEILDNAKEQLELIKTLGDSVRVIEKLEMDLENGKVLHDNLENDIEVGTPLQENLHSDIVEAKKWKDQLHQDVTDGKVLQPLLQQTVDDAEDIKVRLDNSIADAQEDIAIIEAMGNKEILIQSSQWTLRGDIYEKEITHDLNSENLHVTAKNSNTKEAVTIGYKIIDKTRILLKSDEAINMSVILSASYYHATQTISDNIAEEVVKARKGEVDLKTKIDSIDEQLDNIANKGTTVEVLERVTKEEIDRQVADGTIANLTIKDSGITSQKIKRGAILLEHESWLNVTKLNIFDESKATVGKYIGSDGILRDSPSGSLMVSDYISVEEGNQYCNSVSRSSAFFDINKKYISGLDANFSNPFTAPDGACYIRLTYGVSDTKVLCEGDKIIDNNAKYGDYKLNFNNEDLKNLLIKTIGNESSFEDGSITSSMIKKGAILLEHESWLNVTKLNIFDINSATIGKYLNVNGDILDSPSGTLLHSDYIEVDEGKEYFNSNTRVICFYDSNKTYISGLNTNAYTNPFTVPAGVKYVRIVYNKSDTKVLCEGDTLIDPNASFGDYKLSWNSTEFKNLIKETSNNEICTSGMNMIVFGDSITATASMNDDGTNYKEVSTNWPTYTKESLKVSGFKNFGRAGAAYRYRSDVEFRQSLTNQVQLAIDNNVEADIIVFSAGTNDWEANMGTFDTAMSKTTLDDLDITKTYEAIRWCFWKIKKHYPNAICFVATPIQRADVEPFYKIIEAIIKMAERYNFIVIPAHSESGIIRDFETQGASGRWLYDGLHPGENGKKMMAKLYTRVILNSLQNYI